MTRIEQLADGIFLHLGDCRDVLPTLGKADAVVTDPPYGLADKWQGGKIEWPLHHQDDDEMAWDAQTCEAVHGLPALAEHAIIWGGNLYPMPPSRGWLIWDKKTRGFTSGDCEVAWTTLDQPIKAFSLARSILTPGGGDPKFHPTQKPVALMEWCLEQIPAAITILDPFMGVGTTGIAAIKRGRRFVGVEFQTKYFDIACRRVSDALKQQDLFVSKPEPKKPAQLSFDSTC